MELETIYSGSAYDWELYQNADRTFEIQKFDSNGALLPWGGLYGARMQFKAENSETVIFEASSENGLITFPSDGVLLISFPHAATANVTPGVYRYDLHLFKLDDSFSDYLIFGRVTLRQRVSS